MLPAVFTLPVISSAVEKRFNFMQSHFSVLETPSCVIRVFFLASSCLCVCFAHASSSALTSHRTHYKVTFVHRERYGRSFIIFRVNIQLS